MRKIVVVTTSRADWWIWKSVLAAMRESRNLNPLVASSWFGREDGADIEVDLLAPDGSARRTAEIMGDAVREFALEFAEAAPDVVLVLGDRYEMHSAALACLPLRIPVAHVHGGESTTGVFDEQLRNSITKLSHVHFASHPDYAARIIRMGENPKNVHVVGAPALDNLRHSEPGPPPMEGDYVLATLHPETLSPIPPRVQAACVLSALDHIGIPVFFTGVNSDPGCNEVDRAITEFVNAHPDSRAIETLGDKYYDAMRGACAMVGNSSSGIIEAPSFNLPVVNVGGRQAGRVRGGNTYSASWNSHDIEKAISAATTLTARVLSEEVPNPYDRGGASERIVRVLEHVDLGPELLRKEFYG